MEFISISSETYSHQSGSMIQALDFFLLPINLKNVLFELSSSSVSSYRTLTHETINSVKDPNGYIHDLFDELYLNNTTILIFEANKTSETVKEKVKVKFTINNVPVNIGNGTNFVSLLAFINKSGHIHYEALSIAPNFPTSFKLIDASYANKSVRIMSVPKNYKNMLYASSFPTCVTPLSSSIKKVSEIHAQRYYAPISEPKVVVTKTVQQKPVKSSNIFACLSDDYNKTSTKKSQLEKQKL